MAIKSHHPSNNEINNLELSRSFYKKAETILLQQPNIFVFQEWEHPDKLFFNSTTQLPNDFL